MVLKKLDVDAMAESVMMSLVIGKAQYILFSMDRDEREAFRIGLSEAIYKELKKRKIAE